MKEYQLQKEVCKYLDFLQVLYCASLGGQYQVYKSQRIKAVKSGYKKGFPDLFIYEIAKIENEIYAGLAIELKTKKGRPTPQQIYWITELNNRGYKAAICKGLNEAIELIELYIKNKI